MARKKEKTSQIRFEHQRLKLIFNEASGDDELATKRCFEFSVNMDAQIEKLTDDIFRHFTIITEDPNGDRIKNTASIEVPGHGRIEISAAHTDCKRILWECGVVKREEDKPGGITWLSEYVSYYDYRRADEHHFRDYVKLLAKTYALSMMERAVRKIKLTEEQEKAFWRRRSDDSAATIFPDLKTQMANRLILISDPQELAVS